MLTRLEPRDPRWTAFLDERPDATPFHHPSWSELIASSYGFPSFALALVDRETGVVRAGTPVVETKGLLGKRRWVSLPFTDACSPLAAGTSELHELLAALEAERSSAGVSSVELRARVDVPGATQRDEGFMYRSALASDPQEVRARFRRSHVWKNIVAAEKRGVTVLRAATEADLCDVFYELQTRTRRRHGLPVQPRGFFRDLWRTVIEPGHGFALLAYYEKLPVAGAVFLSSNGTLVYKYSATHDLHRNSGGTHLILWRAIEWGCANGYSELDLGRTEAHNQGLRDFKSAWGAGEEPLTYTHLGAPGDGGGAGRAATLVGPLITRSPLVVARVLGRLLYRYAA